MESVLNLIGSTSLVSRYATFSAGAHLAAARNEVAHQFLDDGNEPWLWMIDTDIVFPPGLPSRLLTTADLEKRPVVTGLYWTTTAGGMPLVPMIYDRHPGASPEFTPCRRWQPGAVIRVDGCGAGCLLIHRRVLTAIRAVDGGGQAWFGEIRDSGRAYGEDLSFCLRVTAAGFPIHADTAVQAGHVKAMVIGAPGSVLASALSPGVTWKPEPWHPGC